MTPSIIPEKPPLIIACCAWYHERPDMLARMVTSLDGVADRLVALDGPWQSYLDGNHDAHPELALTSPPEQRQAIIDAALRIKLPCLVEHPVVPWLTQHHKRAHLMDIGRQWSDSPESWLLVIDGDEEIRHPIHAQFHRTLQRTPTDRIVATVKGPSNSRMHRLFRAHPDLTVEGGHNGYRLKNGPWLATMRYATNGDGRAPTANLSGHLELIHHHNARDEERKKSGNRERILRHRRGEQ